MIHPQDACAAGGRVMRRFAVALALCVLGAGGALAADDWRALVRQGNAEYDAGRYDEALKRYEQAAADPASASSLELLHNRAAAQFKLGRLAEAREHWVRAKEAGDKAFEARTRYNLGNVDYAEALQAIADPNAGAAKAGERLGRAIEEYRAALRLDPELADARANLELTHRLKKQLEMLPKSEQQRPDASQNSESQDPNQQQQQAGQQQGQQDPNQQDPQQPDQQQQPGDQSAGEPRDEQPSPQAGEPQDPNGPSPEEQQAPSQPPQPDPNSNSTPQPQEAQQGDPNAGASEADAQAEPQPAPDPNQPQPAGDPNAMTDQQAERLLQMVRDAERSRREMLVRQRQQRQEPVDKDW